MDRELALVLLTLAVTGPILLAAASWPQRYQPPASARHWERIAWRALWMPTFPAAVAVATLVGWAVFEPPDAEFLPSSVIATSAVFAGIWIRALIRAARATRRPKSMPPASSLGLWHPRIVLSEDLTARLDADALEAVNAHETAHVRHHDPLRIWLAQVATDLQWPSRDARKRFDDWRRVLELARDEEARQDGIDGADLAAAILVAASSNMISVRGAALIGNRSALQDRITRLLSPLPPDVLGRSRMPTLALVPTCLLSAASGARFGESMIQILIRALP